MQGYEDAVAFLGTWGHFQRRIFFLLCLSCIPCGYNILCINFLLASPPHNCHIPIDSNLSHDWIQASIPVQLVVSEHLEKSSCSRYDLDLMQNLSALGLKPSVNQTQNQSTLGTSPEVVVTSLKQEGCKDGWTYSTEYYESTAVTEFDLVCSNQWKQPLTSFMYFLGGFFGCFFSGLISDRFGRKPVLFGSIALLSIFSSVLALAPSWLSFTVLFFMLGLGQLSCYIAVFVLGSEILVGSARVLFSSLGIPFFYVSGMMMLSGTAYLVRKWRYLSLIMAVPGMACIPLWWLIPESPRWLVSCSRLQEADLLLRAAAQENRVEAPPVIFMSTRNEVSQSNTEKSLGFMDLLRTTNIRHITLLLWPMWFFISVSYFGLSFNLSSLYGSPFLNYFMLVAVELPAYGVSWLAVRRLPRRLSFIGFSLLGVLAPLFIPITQNHPHISLFLVLLAKFGVLASFGLLFVYTGEVFPTVIRSTAMSSCAMFSRVGALFSPYLLQLAVYYQFLPWIAVCCLSLLSLLLCILLPETFKKPLPDTIQQMPVTQF